MWGKTGSGTRSLFMFADRRSALGFWLGSGVVTAGVLLHLPMFWMARNMGFVLAGMPMDPGMILGMALIVSGIAAAGYGLLPRAVKSNEPFIAIAPPEDAPLTAAHWMLMAVLSVALIIDIMKPASLGFVTPGMRSEYAIGKATVAMLPFCALVGTAVGSFVWGALADIYRRRHAVVLVEPGDVLFDGGRGGRHAAGDLCTARRADADQAPQLVPGAGRRRRRGRRLSGVQRVVGAAPAPLRLADHVVPQPADRPHPDRAQPVHSGIGALPGDDGPHRRGTKRAGAVRRLADALDRNDRKGCGRGSYAPAAGRSRVPRDHGGADACRARLGLRQFRRVAVAAGHAGGGRPQRGRGQRAHRQIGALRRADGRARDLALQRLEHQMVARLDDRDDGPGACGAAPARQRRRSARAGRSSHRRLDRRDLDPSALRGRELPLARARKGDGLGGGLQQGRRPHRAGLGRAGAGPGAGPGRRHRRGAGAGLARAHRLVRPRDARARSARAREPLNFSDASSARSGPCPHGPRWWRRRARLSA